MPLYVKDRATEQAVRDLAAAKGLSVTAAIRQAVENEIKNDAELRQREIARKLAAIAEIQRQFAELPVLNPEVNADDWMYDENGLPH